MTVMNSYGDLELEDFPRLMEALEEKLINTRPVNVGEWQSQKKEIWMREIRNVNFAWDMPGSRSSLAALTQARLPWAEDHFLERVGGQPLNPSPSEAWWPFAKKSTDNTNADHKSEGEAFSHTYPERMWPKWANIEREVLEDGTTWGISGEVHQGIRFEYGDLKDVVNQLIKTPMTRQAYLPIWFPEDTGAVHGKRVPCTLGYHFTIRDGTLDISYFMRSTDLLRHFQDDVYLAVRLASWVSDRIGEATGNFPIMGSLIFHTANLHIFDADVEMIQYKRENRA